MKISFIVACSSQKEVAVFAVAHATVLLALPAQSLGGDQRTMQSGQASRDQAEAQSESTDTAADCSEEYFGEIVVVGVFEGVVL